MVIPAVEQAFVFPDGLDPHGEVIVAVNDDGLRNEFVGAGDEGGDHRFAGGVEELEVSVAPDGGRVGVDDEGEMDGLGGLEIDPNSLRDLGG